MAEVNFSDEDTLKVVLAPEETIKTTVPDINYIPGYKIAEDERRANELERIANENEREELYEEIQEKYDNGELNGKNTVYVGEEEPTDDYYNVWIDPEGMPGVEASHLIFDDNETLQEKYENGELKGPKGDTGAAGTNGIDGKDGKDGTNGYTPVKGVDYFTTEEINSILQEAKDYTDNEIATFDFIKIVQELPETGLVNRTYFVPKATDDTNDLYDEYMWVNNAWEFVGTKQIEVDLTDYYNKAEVDARIEEHSIADYDSLPVGSVIDYDGDTVPTGYEEVADSNNYSTEEQIIGTWISGVPIYRKVISYATPSAKTQNDITIDTTSLKIKWLVNAYGPVKKSDGSGIMMMSDTQAIVITTEGYLKLYFNNTSSEAFTGYLTLEYTKTTD